jgi:ABC-type multidrug transport system ATPase subunit
MIEIRNLVQRFGRTVAVNDVSLNVAAGQAVALWGANGAGKSTLIRCILGLYRYSGSIRVDGVDVRRDGKTARRLIGYVPQELGFYDDLRVYEAIRYFGRLKGQRGDDIDSVLDQVGLRGHGGKRIRELSGGMKQRLALAIALLGDPPVLILDEVTASLDAGGRDHFVGVLRDLLISGRRAVLFASHRPEEIQALASRVVALDAGKVVSDLSVNRSSTASPTREGIDLRSAGDRGIWSAVWEGALA